MSSPSQNEQPVEQEETPHDLPNNSGEVTEQITSEMSPSIEGGEATESAHAVKSVDEPVEGEEPTATAAVEEEEEAVGDETQPKEVDDDNSLSAKATEPNEVSDDALEQSNDDFQVSDETEMNNTDDGEVEDESNVNDEKDEGEGAVEEQETTTTVEVDDTTDAHVAVDDSNPPEFDGNDLNSSDSGKDTVQTNEDVVGEEIQLEPDEGFEDGVDAKEDGDLRTVGETELSELASASGNEEDVAEVEDEDGEDMNGTGEIERVHSTGRLSASPSLRSAGSSGFSLGDDGGMSTGASFEENKAKLIAIYAEAMDEYQKLYSTNGQLQRRLAETLKLKKTEDSREEKMADYDARYSKCLAQIDDQKDELERLKNHYDRSALDLQARVDEKESVATALSAEFLQYKSSVTRSAQYSRTGKLIPENTLSSMESTRERRETEVEKVRLRNIELRNTLRKLEQRLRKKEELGDGLHLIDFEQLKIENQTYNEKIEERNEELLKLRKKITQTVQVLTHVKEKLQFVQGENGELKRELSGLEGQVQSRRDTLARLKQERDRTRSENIQLKQQSGLVGSEELLRDYESRNEEMKNLADRLSHLQGRHRGLMQDVLTYQTVMAEGGARGGRR